MRRSRLRNVGEFNAGKSTIINALLGSRHLKDGITPTTDRVTLIKHNQPDEIVPSIARPQVSCARVVTIGDGLLRLHPRSPICHTAQLLPIAGIADGTATEASRA
eukprot:SAG31_NODE_690_length_12796_cov_4.634559_15_plen_105_part_00